MSKCFEKSLLIGIITINRIAKLNKTVGKKITRETIELNCSQLNIEISLREVTSLCLVPVRWRKVNKSPVCFEAKGNRFGRFYVPEGRLAAIKLVHLYGYVSCHVRGPSFWSYWGCGDNTWMGINTQVNVVITNSSDHILLPPSKFLKHRNAKWYWVPGYNSLSRELVLPFFSSPKLVHSNQELRVWYGEDLANLSWERDNGGNVCADVYALFV